MDVEYLTNEKVCVISPQENLTLATAKAFKTALDPLVEDTALIALMINCAEVRFIDSTGIGLLAGIHKRLIQRGAQLILVNLSQQNASFFKVTGVDQIIQIFPTRTAALAALQTLHLNETRSL